MEFRKFDPKNMCWIEITFRFYSLMKIWLLNWKLCTFSWILWVSSLFQLFVIFSYNCPILNGLQWLKKIFNIFQILAIMSFRILPIKILIMFKFIHGLGPCRQVHNFARVWAPLFGDNVIWNSDFFGGYMVKIF